MKQIKTLVPTVLIALLAGGCTATGTVEPETESTGPETMITEEGNEVPADVHKEPEEDTEVKTIQDAFKKAGFEISEDMSTDEMILFNIEKDGYVSSVTGTINESEEKTKELIVGLEEGLKGYVDYTVSVDDSNPNGKVISYKVSSNQTEGRTFAGYPTNTVFEIMDINPDNTADYDKAIYMYLNSL